MDACFEILLSTRQTLEYLECHQETFTWGNIEYPQGEKYYLWGKYIKLVERKIPPHIIKRLPPAYGNMEWLNFSVQGKGLDLLESEVNGSEIDWEGKSFDDFLKFILTEQPQWVVIFEWHCDRIDSLYQQNVSECICQMKNNLKWDNNREGFMVLSVPENEVGSSAIATEWEFAEIWADTLISPPYILMLVKEKSGIFCIHNPAQNYKIIFSSDNYEAAKIWLLEDEYERLNSRILQEV